MIGLMYLEDLMSAKPVAHVSLLFVITDTFLR